MSLLHLNDEPGQYPESWYAEATPQLPRMTALEGDVASDICVVGGGYTGLSAALHLARMGFSVRLLEAHRVGFGASGRNGGQVGSGQRLGQPTLEGMLGRDYARRLWMLGEAAKAKVRTLIAEYGIDCDWRDGVANADVTGRDAARNLAEARHLAKTYGYDRLELLDRDGIARETGSRAYAGGVIDWGAGHMNPLAFALGLARAFGLTPVQSTVLLAFSALPTASSAYVLAARMGYNGGYVAGLVTLSTLLGLVSLPFALGLLA